MSFIIHLSLIIFSSRNNMKKAKILSIFRVVPLQISEETYNVYFAKPIVFLTLTLPKVLFTFNSIIVVTAMKNFNTALVTGANKGIGFEVARQLAEKGFHVFLTARHRETGQQAAAQLQRTGAKISFVALDVADEASIKRAAQEVAARADHLDVLVNNAAILEDENLSVLDISTKLMQKTLLTNTVGPLVMAQAFYALLAKSGDGRIINVSSSAGSLSEMETYAPAYSVSKTALNAVTVQLAAQLKSEGIAVNAVCPGWVRTDMGGRGAPRSVQQGADTIVWLATEAPKNLSGKFFRDRKVMAW
jgi:NAD(P)-dependent dehydrogenase (short-subunit alcohol dehydrogenase family)